jgi:RNA polymerase sigma-70 factor (ECF subfamily)
MTAKKDRRKKREKISRRDRKLVQRIGKGDQSAYRELFDCYHKVLFKFCGRYKTLERENLADIVQQTFMKAFENIKSLKDGKLFGSWILMIARNEVISHMRKQKKESITIAKVVNDPTTLSQDDPYIREQIYRSLENAVKEVADPISKHIADLYYGTTRITTREISEKLGIPKGTVTTKLKRLRQLVHSKMIERLAEHDFPWYLPRDHFVESDDGGHK